MTFDRGFIAIHLQNLDVLGASVQWLLLAVPMYCMLVRIGSSIAGKRPSGQKRYWA